MTRSQANARCAPRPAATPLTAGDDRLLQLPERADQPLRARAHHFARRAGAGRTAAAAATQVGAGAEPLPAPVSTTARMSEIRARVGEHRRAALRASRRSPRCARRAGSSVIHATWFSIVQLIACEVRHRSSPVVQKAQAPTELQRAARVVAQEELPHLRRQARARRALVSTRSNGSSG